MIDNIVIFKTFKSRQNIKKTGSYLFKDDDTVFNDKDIKKVFQNAINKNTFTWPQVRDQDNYIMYMCSNTKYDYFKSKLTKTSYRVER